MVAQLATQWKSLRLVQLKPVTATAFWQVGPAGALALWLVDQGFRIAIGTSPSQPEARASAQLKHPTFVTVHGPATISTAAEMRFV
jgi:hypothetical protein